MYRLKELLVAEEMFVMVFEDAAVDETVVPISVSISVVVRESCSGATVDSVIKIDPPEANVVPSTGMLFSRSGGRKETAIGC